MIRFIKKLIKAIKISSLLDKAWASIALKEVKEAEKYFDQIDFLISDLCAEHQIMKAYIKFKASKYKEAKFLFDGSWKKIDRDKKLSNSEKNYFKGYTLEPSKITLDFLKYDNPNEPGYENIRDFDLIDIDLQLVAKKWKVHFPIRDHPDWDKYGVK